MNLSKSKHFFTLIEILVVVTIIAILSAMLFPKIGKYIEHARRTECAANLKGIGVGLASYMKSQDGFFPTAAQKWIGEGRELSSYVSDEKAFCPSDTNARQDTDGTSYTSNHFLDGDTTSSAANLSGESIIYPSQTLTVMESGGYWFIMRNGTETSMKYHNRDEGDNRWNFLFYDGHVEYFEPTEPRMNSGYINLNDTSIASWTLNQAIDPE